MRVMRVGIGKFLKQLCMTRLACVFFSGLIISQSIQADLTIEITQGNDRALPVAVVPFSWSGEGVLSEDMSGVVSSDLELSGRFKSLDRADFQSFPSTEPEVYYRDWHMLGTSYLVIGSVSQGKKNKLSVSYQLFDVKKKQSVLSETAEGVKDGMRDIAHKISDRIYEKITGVRGAFSTKILYVKADWEDDSDDQTVDKVEYQLIYADMDGMRSQTLLESKEPIMSPTWSPDGKKIAYVSFESGRPAIYIQQLANGKREKLTGYRGLNAAPVWSPDGKTMALTLSKAGSADIYTLDIKSRKLTRLTSHFAIDNEPTWAPSGKELFFTSDRGGSAQIYRLDLMSNAVSRVTFNGVFNARSKSFPDGNSLVMIHKQDRGYKGYNVGVMNLKTGRFRVVATQRFTDSPAVSPNGEMVLFASQEEQKGVLGIVSMDGRASYRLPSSEGDVREPAWSPFEAN